MYIRWSLFKENVFIRIEMTTLLMKQLLKETESLVLYSDINFIIPFPF